MLKECGKDETDSGGAIIMRQPTRTATSPQVAVDQVTLVTAAGLAWATRRQDTPKLSDHMVIFGIVRLLCL